MVKCGDSVVSAIPLDRHEEVLTELADEMAPVVALRRRLKEAATDDEKHELRLRIEALLAPIRARVCAVARGPRPFAYPLEFPEVFFGGACGFAAVVGNPPYVDTRLGDYDGLGLASVRAKNLYAYILENGIRYLRPGGRFGMITMLPLVCTLRMEGIQQYMLEQAEEVFVSTFDRRPNHLFRDANIRHAIVFGQKNVCPIPPVDSIRQPINAGTGRSGKACSSGCVTRRPLGYTSPAGYPRSGKRWRVDYWRRYVM